jgi:hypothetical protein
MAKNEKSLGTIPDTTRIEWTDSDGQCSGVVLLDLKCVSLPSLQSLALSVAAELRRRGEANPPDRVIDYESEVVYLWGEPVTLYGFTHDSAPPGDDVG